MDGGLFIAIRYLFARKSHNVINVISAISAIGMAIGTTALILILSIYNGFSAIIEKNMSDIAPDILICRADKRTFVPGDELIAKIDETQGLTSVNHVLEESVLISYNDSQAIAKAKGVDRQFEEESPLLKYVTTGEFKLHKGELEQAAVGVLLARQLNINPRFLEKLTLFYPKSDAKFSLLSPLNSINSERLVVESLFSVNTSIDKELIILPIETMQRLLGATDEAVSSIEIRCEDSKIRDIKKEFSKLLGKDFLVLDRLEQDPALYKMMRYEKLAIYMILIFVLVIIAFNIFGSLSMLIIEKEEDIKTLSAIGASKKFIKRIFVLEGWMVSLLGLVAGLVLGVGLSLLQQHFGLVKMPQGFFLQAYPAQLQCSDVLITAISVALIGFLIALLSISKKEFKTL